MAETSASYDPNAPEDAYSPREGDDQPAQEEDPFGAQVAEEEPAPAAGGAGALENSASGAAALSNPLSRPTSRTEGDGAAAHGSSGNMVASGNPPPNRQNTNAGALKRGSMVGSMRRSSSHNLPPRGGRAKSFEGGNGQLTKRGTLAGMMLSGKFNPDDDKGADSGAGAGRRRSSAAMKRKSSQSGGAGAQSFEAFMAGEMGEQVPSEGNATESQIDVVDQGDDYDDYYGEAGAIEAEQIFMPNMRREQYVPVRIARDKLKAVLREMAQMKHMHYAALETMERQQEFLKAQLEATVATYARKLTNDYNARVKGLEAEYQRRLDGLNKTALGDLQSTLEAAQRESRTLEARMQEQIKEKDREIEQERALFQQKVQMARQAGQESEKEAEELKQQMKEKDAQIEQLTIDLRVAKATAAEMGSASGTHPAGGGGGADEALKAKVSQLEGQVAALTQERDEAVSDAARLQELVDARDQEIAALHEQLAAGADPQELVVGGADDDEDEEEGGAVVVGGDDDDE